MMMSGPGRGWHPPPVPGRPGDAEVVSFANWPGYIDTDPADPARHPTLAEFTRRTAIAVNYIEPIGSDDQFFARIGVPLAMGASTGYDLVVLSDWMVAQLIGLGWAEEISPDGVPHAANLLPELQAAPLADVGSHSLPWQAGFTGIGYNLAATGREVAGISDLLTSPDLKGRVSLVCDMRDVMGLLLLDRGVDPALFTATEFDLAVEEIRRAAESGQIRTVTNSYRGGLDRGDIAACVGWSGDVLAVGRSNPQVRFVLPEAGGMLWTDNMLIPAHARCHRHAERLMDYYYEPEVAARLAAFQLFICPVRGAEAALRRHAPDLAGEEYVFPSPRLLARAHHFARLTQVQSAVCTEKFTSALGL